VPIHVHTLTHTRTRTRTRTHTPALHLTAVPQLVRVFVVVPIRLIKVYAWTRHDQTKGLPSGAHVGLFNLQLHDT